MQVTTKGRYAVMAMADLAVHANGSPIQLATVAYRTQIDFGYLEQIFIKLKKAALIKSTKGPGGGYQIAKPISDISLFDIMHAVEEGLQMTRCSKGKTGCMEDNLQCMTHHIWEALEKNISDFLSKITLESICTNRTLKNVVGL